MLTSGMQDCSSILVILAHYMLYAMCTTILCLPGKHITSLFNFTVYWCSKWKQSSMYKFWTNTINFESYPFAHTYTLAHHDTYSVHTNIYARTHTHLYTRAIQGRTSLYMPISVTNTMKVKAMCYLRWRQYDNMHNKVDSSHHWLMLSAEDLAC